MGEDEEEELTIDTFQEFLNHLSVLELVKLAAELMKWPEDKEYLKQVHNAISQRKEREFH